MTRTWDVEYTDQDATVLERTMLLCAAIGLTFALGYVAARQTQPRPCTDSVTTHCKVQP